MTDSTSVPHAALSVKGELSSVLYNTLSLLLSLCRRRGFCFAHNEYLSAQLGVSERQVSRRITALVNAGYIVACRVGNERHVRPMTRQCLPASTTKETSTKRQQTASEPPASLSDPTPVVVSQKQGFPPDIAPLVEELRQENVQIHAAMRKALSETNVVRLRSLLAWWQRQKANETARGVGLLAAAILREYGVGEVREAETERFRYRLRTEAMTTERQGVAPDVGAIRARLTNKPAGRYDSAL